jgi:hypothetical protein
MTKFLTSFVSAFFLIFTSIAALAQELSLKERIEIGTNAIKLGCGLESHSIAVEGSANGAITLSKLPSKNSPPQVHYTSRETVGLIAAFQKEMTEAGRKLSESQLKCMQSYVDRIVGAVFPNISEPEQRDIRQACLATCDDTMNACKNNETSKFSQCIEDRRQKCIDECVHYYGYPRYRCVSELCNSKTEIYKDDWSQVCRVSEDLASCSKEKAICRSECLQTKNAQ